MTERSQDFPSHRLLQRGLGFVLLITLIVLSASRAVQGIDFTDTGFYLSNYKYFFSGPDNIIYSQTYWFSNFVGAVLWWATSGSGLFVINIIGLVIFAAFIFYSLKFWQRYFPDTVSRLWIVLLGAVLVVPYTYIPNYNSMSMMLMGLSTLLLIDYRFSQKTWLVLLSGFLFGLSVGCRFPNLVYLIAVFYLWDGDSRNSFKAMGMFVLGLLISLAAQWGLVIVLGHQEAIAETLMLARQKVFDTQSTHSAGKLLRAYFDDITGSYRKVIYVFILFFLGKFLISKFSLPEKLSNRATNALFYSVMGLLIYVLISSENGSRLNLEFTLIALLYFAVKDRCGISYLMMVFTLALSSGSNSGLFNSRSAFILTLPWLIYKLHLHLKSNPTYQMLYTAKFAYLLLLVISLKTIKETWRDTYRDHALPSEMTSATVVPAFKNMRTTEARAKMINELYVVLQKIPEGTQIIPYSEMSGLFLMGNWNNPIYNVWPDGYSPSQFSYAFNKGVVLKNLRPVIIFNKLSLRDRYWPTSLVEVPDRQKDPNFIQLNQFKDSHNYALTWENDYFEIWSPL